MTNVIVESVIEQIVNAVADEVEKRMEAKGRAAVTLEPEVLKESLLLLVERDTSIRDAVRDIFTDSIDSYDLTDNADFKSLVDKVDELDEVTIDADNDTFADAVREVIRTNI